MDRKHSRRRRGFLATLPSALALTAYLIVGGSVPAQAATGCWSSAPLLTVRIAASSTNAIFSVNGSDDLVVSNVVGCTGPYPDIYTMEIVVDGTGATDETITFVDPLANWPSTEVNVDLGDEGANGDRIVLQGTSSGETFSTSDPVDVATSIEHWTLLGLGGDDTLYGDDTDDTLDGGTGDDELWGYEGNDTIAGGSGSGVDTIYAGYGDDTATGGDGNDEIWGWYGDDSIDAGIGADTVYAGEGDDTVMGGTGADELWGWYGNDVLVGGDGTDTLYGGYDDDRLYGGAGADEIYGYGGTDLLDGGSGGDYLDGGDGVDTAHYDGSRYAVQVNLYADTAAGGDAVGDELDDIENLSGSSKNDTLTGDDGINVLWGNSGNDTLIGYDDDDTLIGGSGRDSVDGDAGDDACEGYGLGLSKYKFDSYADCESAA